MGGVQRVERKIKAEKAFLDSVIIPLLLTTDLQHQFFNLSQILSGHTALRDTHLSSTNLTHIQAVLQIAQETRGLVAVQQCFSLVPGLGMTPVCDYNVGFVVCFPPLLPDFISSSASEYEYKTLVYLVEWTSV